jgi:glycosyltransferase involved in cell wall biosynthesis
MITKAPVSNQFPAPATYTSVHGDLPTITAVIPTKNEAKNLPHVIPFIPAWVTEILVVDAHSTDDTVEVAHSLSSRVRVIQQVGKGKGAALRTGFVHAKGEIIVMLDADGSTDPREIPLFISALLAGADFVKGSRFMQGGRTADMELHRMLGNAGLLLAARVLFGGSFTDLCYGYAAFWSSIIHQLNLDGDGFEIETMMNIRALRNGYRVAEVPSFERRRIHGSSNLRAIPDGIRVLRTIIMERIRPRTAITFPPFIGDLPGISEMTSNNG